MKKLLLYSLLVFCFYSAKAQDDLLSSLEKEDSAKVQHSQNFTTATFKSTRIIEMPSIEMTGKGNLQFMITHHFGQIWNDRSNVWGNASQLFGLNAGAANTYLSFDYSPLNWLNIGLATTGNSQIESWAKFRILRQQTGLKNIPVSVIWLSTAHIDGSNGSSPNDLAWNRFSFLHQVLVAGKFNENFSLEFVGSMVHYNLGYYGYDNSNNIFSAGFGGRYKLTRKSAITFEYSRQLNMYKNVTEDAGTPTVNYNPDLISLGYDWDTGGHIFQFFISNTSAASNLTQLSRNTSDRWKGFALGFNINRSFGIKKAVKAPK